MAETMEGRVRRAKELSSKGENEWMEAEASRGFLRNFRVTEGASSQDGSTFEVQSFVLTKPAMAARSQDAPVRPKTPVLP